MRFVTNGVLSLDAMISAVLYEVVTHVLTAFIVTEYPHTTIRLILNPRFELLESVKGVRLVPKKLDRNKASCVIDERNPVTMAVGRLSWHRSVHIGMNECKRTIVTVCRLPDHTMLLPIYARFTNRIGRLFRIESKASYKFIVDQLLQIGEIQVQESSMP